MPNPTERTGCVTQERRGANIIVDIAQFGDISTCLPAQLPVYLPA